MLSWATRSKRFLAERQVGSVGGSEGDPPVGVEADLGLREANHLLGDVDAAHARSRELAGKEQGRLAGAGADVERPLGRRARLQRRRRQRGEVRDGARARALVPAESAAGRSSGAWRAGSAGHSQGAWATVEFRARPIRRTRVPGPVRLLGLHDRHDRNRRGALAFPARCDPSQAHSSPSSPLSLSPGAASSDSTSKPATERFHHHERGILRLLPPRRRRSRADVASQGAGDDREARGEAHRDGRDELRALRDRPRYVPAAEDRQLVRLPGETGLLRRPRLPPRGAAVSSSREATRSGPDSADRATRWSRSRRPTRSTGAVWSPWRRQALSRQAHRGASSSSSPRPPTPACPRVRDPGPRDERNGCRRADRRVSRIRSSARRAGEPTQPVVIRKVTVH